MQHRSLALVFTIIGILYSGLVSALGLGEITLKSQFNQPLNAEIRLLKVRDLSEEEILVSLANANDFQRAGVERIFFLTGLNFEVVLNNPSYPFIRVTSRKPITEPYLNFLIETQWPSGRLLREYTLLLDLPVFSSTPSNNAVVSSPSSSNRVQSSSPRANQYTQSRSGVSAPAPVSSSVGSSFSQSQAVVDSYRVTRGDTLWEIAEKVKPSGSVTVHQTMIALQQSNPEAFIGGNINRLKNGRVLRVPSADEIANISYNQAVSAVKQQNQSWSSANNTKAVLTSAPVSAPAPTGSAPEGRLTLGSADSGNGDVKGSGASGAGLALQGELNETRDELSKTTRENSELKSRINDLESQIDTMEKLIQVTNDQLKSLQLATQNQAEQTLIESTDEVNDSTEASIDDQELLEGLTENTVSEELDSSLDLIKDDAEEALGQVTDDTNVEEVLKPEIDEAVVDEAPIVPPVEVAPVQGSGFDLMGFIKENMLAVGGIFAALLAGIILLFRLREKPEDEENDFASFDDDEDDGLLDLDGFEEDSVDEAELSPTDDVEAQTEDVVAEADIYVSLGQEDKAIELLEKEIQQNPDNADARLGVLKIFAASQNVVAFDEQYAQLLPLGNVSANDQAMALRKGISDVQPFDTDQYSSVAESEDAFESLGLGDDFDEDVTDIDLDLDDELDTEDGLATSDIGDDSIDSELDLDLGDVSLDSEDDLSGDSLSFTESDSLDLDLDLDLDSSTSSANPVEEMGEDLDKLDVDSALDDLEFSIDQDFEKTLDELDDGLSIDVDDNNAEAVMEFDLDFEGIESADIDLPENEAEELEDALDLTPSDDMDLASLDEEIDAMTADLDDSLDLDEDMGLDEVLDLGESLDSEDLSLDLDVSSDLDLSSDNELSLDEVETPDVELSLDDDVADLTSDTVNIEADDSMPSAELNLDNLDGEEDILDEDLDSLSNADDLSIEEDLNVLDTDTEEDLDILSAEEADGLNSDLDDTILVDDLDDTSSAEEDDDLDFLEASDEVSTKLDLARAYIDMGDVEGAEDILNEVLEEGNNEQKTEADSILKTL